MLSSDNEYNVLNMKKSNQLVTKKPTTTKESIIYVATFDGTLMAISYRTGDVLWKMNNKFYMYIEAEYFGNNFNENVYFTNKNKNITQKSQSNYNIYNEYVIPSIDGRIYHFKNNQYKVITDSFKDFIHDNDSTYSNTNYVRSTVEILLIGVDPWNGQIYYECNGFDCDYPHSRNPKLINHPDHHVDHNNIDLSLNNILLVEYQMFRRFNTNLKTGKVNWNVTHNAYTLRYVDHEDLFSNDQPPNDAANNLSNNTSLSNFLRYDALNDVLENIEYKWSNRLKSPIVGLWFLSKSSGLHKLNLQTIIYIPRVREIVKNILENGKLCEDSLLLFSFNSQPYFVPIVNFQNNNDRNETVITTNCCCATIYTITELISDDTSRYSYSSALNEAKAVVGLFGSAGPIRKVASSDSKANFHVNGDKYYYKLQSYGSFESINVNYNLQLLPTTYNAGDNISSHVLFVTVSYWTNKILHILKLFGIIGSLVTVFYNTIYFCIRRTFDHFRRLPESSPLTIRKSSSFIQMPEHNINAAVVFDPSTFNNKYNNEMPATIPPVTISRYMSDFVHIKKLGKGGFGHVYMAKNIIDECEYAIKRIRLPECTSARIRVMREVQALAKLNHPGVVRFYNAWFEPTITSQDPINKNIRFIPLCPTLQDDSELSLYSDDSHENCTEFDHTSNDDHDGDHLEVDINNPFVIPKDALHQIPSDSNGASFEEYSTKDDREDCSMAEHLSSACTHNFHSDLYIQMQLCKSETLHEWLEKNVSDRDIHLCIHYFKQILEAIAYIHSQDFIHRDLKPSNIFFSMDGVIKIGDFGLVTHTIRSKKLQDTSRKLTKIKKNPRISVSFSNDDINLHYYTKLVGTELYMAPEQVSCAKYDYTVDIYALALILTELTLPFQTQTERYITLSKIKSLKQNDDLLEKYPTVAQLVEWMLADDPKNRPTANDIIGSDLAMSLWTKYNLHPT